MLNGRNDDLFRVTDDDKGYSTVAGYQKPDLAMYFIWKQAYITRELKSD